MMNLIAIFLLLFISGKVLANENGKWETSFSQDVPSCSLYRHRVANYLNRIQEFELANRAMKNNLNPYEIVRLVELWRRTGVSLDLKETATWSIQIPIEEEFLARVNSVKVNSSFFTWESDKLNFPEEIMRMSYDENKKVLTIELTMLFSYACLQAFDLEIFLAASESEVWVKKFKLNKTESER